MYFNFGPKDIIGIIKRRFFWAAIPFLIVAMGAVLYIKSMDPIYESTATLLVEDQQIRNDYVQSAVESDTLQRIEAIRARVQARDNLLAIANELKLYQNQGLTTTERYEAMTEDTTILVRRVVNSRRGSDASAITVRIAYRSRSASQAQRVTNALLTDFQYRSVELRTEIATDTSGFLREEEQKIRGALDDVATAINQIKADNLNSLPENRDIYERALDRSSAEQSRLRSSITETEQAIKILELQKPLLTRNEEPPTPLETELSAKRRRLEALQLEYQDTYPDVISLKRDVLALERELDPAAFRQRATSEVASLTARLNSTTLPLAERSRLANYRRTLTEQIQSTPNIKAETTLSQLQYDAQMQTLQSRIRALKTQSAEIAIRVAEYENQIAATPVVQGQLFRLEEERRQLQADLSILRTNVAAAERSESLEQQSKAERLTPIEQPTRPDAPVSPDKPRLAILGLAAAGMIAAAFSLIPEVMFAKVYSRDHLQKIIPEVKIVEIPHFDHLKPTVKQISIFSALSVITILLTGLLGFMVITTLI